MSARRRRRVPGRDPRRRVADSRTVPHVAELESPLEAGNADQISADGSAALVTFELRGDDDQTVERVDAAEAAVAAAQESHPELRIEEFGDASLEKAASASLDEDFQRAEFLSLPLTLLILVVAFGALVAAGVPLLLGLTAVMATLGLLGPDEPAVPRRRDDQLGDPAGRARRGSRLLAVLPAPPAR